MGVADALYDTAMVEAVLFRSTGVRLGGMQYGPATNPATRTYTPSGKGVGHVYMHTGEPEELSGRAGPAHKSRFKDEATMVAVIVDILGTAEGKAKLKWLDDHPTVAAGLWLHGASALTVSKPWYGYEQGGAALKKIQSAALNMRAHGDALFITSAYPDQFHAGLNPGAVGFVPPAQG
jgi:hypothetical protein